MLNYATFIALFQHFSTNLFFLVSLQSSMDIQSSDGRALLLIYASSYVTKMKYHDIMYGLLNVQLLNTLKIKLL